MEGRPRYNEERADQKDDSDKESGKKKRRSKAVPVLSRVVQRAEVSISDSWTERFEKIRNRKFGSIIPEVDPVKEEKKKELTKTDLEEQTDQSSKEQGDSVLSEQTNPLEYSANDLPSPITGLEGSGEVDEKYLDSEEPDERHISPTVDQEDAEGDYINTDERDFDEDPVLPIWPIVTLPPDKSSPSVKAAHEATFDLSRDAREPSLGVVAASLESNDSVNGDNLGSAETYGGQVVSSSEETAVISNEIFNDGHSAEEAANTQPERIDQIIRRRAEAQEGVQEVSKGSGNTGEHGGAINTEAVPVFERTREVVINNNPNTGLHLLNYALAKRRDTINKRGLNKKIEQSNARISQLEREVISTNKSNTMYEQQRTNINNNANETVMFTRETGKIPTNVEKVATKNSINNEYERLVQQAEQDIALRFGQKSPEAIQNSGIVSEKYYEQRHEAKDNVLSSMSQPQTQSTVDDAMLLKSNTVKSTSSSPIMPASNTIGQNIVMPHNPDTSHLPDRSAEAQQLIVTSVLGVLAGIIAFLIIYVFTRR